MGSIRSTPDLGSIADAASRPGIDPRVWITQATVIDVGFDPEEGIFADVQYLPDGEMETALVGTGYGGNDFGAYSPLKEGDIVLVTQPMGDPGSGPVIFARLWTASEKPPLELSADGEGGEDVTTDPTLRVEDGAQLRVICKAGASVKIEVTGGGAVEIETDGEAKITGTGGVTIEAAASIKLGAAATNGVARFNDTVRPSTPADGVLPIDMATWMAGVTSVVNAATPPAPGIVPGVPPIIGNILSASVKVRSE